MIVCLVFTLCLTCKKYLFAVSKMMLSVCVSPTNWRGGHEIHTLQSPNLVVVTDDRTENVLCSSEFI